MGGRNVVEDSDDEDNVEGSPPPRPPSGSGISELNLSSIVDMPSSPSSRLMQQSGEPSTGSTGTHYSSIRECSSL